jgi:hypothetical protein
MQRRILGAVSMALLFFRFQNRLSYRVLSKNISSPQWKACALARSRSFVLETLWACHSDAPVDGILDRDQLELPRASAPLGGDCSMLYAVLTAVHVQAFLFPVWLGKRVSTVLSESLVGWIPS